MVNKKRGISEQKLEEIVDAVSKIPNLTNNDSKNKNKVSKELLSVINKGIIQVDNHEIIEYVNSKFCKLTGFTESDLLGKNASELFLVDKATGLEMQKRLKERMDGESENYEVKMKKKLGTTFWTGVKAIPFYDKKRKVIGSIGIHTDITEQKQIFKKLLRIDKEFSGINTAINQTVILVITDTAGIITYANDKFVEISEYSLPELIGRPQSIVNSGYHPPSFFKELWSTIKTGKKWKGEIKNKTKSGKYYWTESTIVPHFDTNGEIDQYVAMRVDISSRKEYEEKQKSFLNISTICNKTPEKLKELYSEIHREISNVISVPNFSILLYNEKRKIFKASYHVSQNNDFKEGDELSLTGGLVEYVYNSGEAMLVDKNELKDLLKQKVITKIFGRIAEVVILVPLVGNTKIIGVIVAQIFDCSRVYSSNDLAYFKFISRQIAQAINRKQTHDTIKKNELYFKKLLENSSDLTIIINSDFSIDYISPSVNTLLGFDVEEVLNTPIQEYILPSEIENAAASIKEAFRKGVFVSGQEFCIKTKTGGYSYFDVVGRTIVENGDPKKLVINAHDITARKKYEKRQSIAYSIAKSSLERLGSLEPIFEFVHTEIMLVIPTSNFFFALFDANNNQVSFPYFKDEYSKEEPKNKSFKNSLTEFVFKKEKTVYLTEEELEDNNNGKLKIYEKQAKSWLGVPVQIAGKTIGVCVIQSYDIVDAFSEENKNFMEFIASQIALIIDKQNVLNDLYNSQQHFKELVENSSDINLLLNKNREITYCSTSIKKILGYEPHELIGKSIVNILHSSDRVFASTAIERAFANVKFILKQEFRVKHKKGHYIYIEATGRRKKNRRNEYELVINTHDITKRKIAEDRIKVKNERLYFTHRLFEHVLSNTDIEVTLKTALWGVRSNIEACTCASVVIYSLDDSETSIVYIDRDNDEGENAEEIQKKESIIGEFKKKETVKKGIPFYCKDLKRVKNKNKTEEDLLKEGIVSYYIYPLFQNNKLIGSLNLGSNKKSFLSEDNIESLKEYAGSISIAVKYSELHETLLKNERNLSSLLNTMSEGVIQVDKEGCVQYVNPKMCYYFNIMPENIINKNISELFPYIYGDSISYLFNMSNQSDISRQITFSCPNESVKWGQMNITMLKEREKVIGAIIIVTNITETVESEEVRRKMIIEGEENERKRLAHDLHDGLGQTIAALSMYVNSLESKLKTVLDTEAFGYYKQAKELTNKAVIETRTISHNIMPRSLEEFGLSQTMVELVESISKIHKNLTVEFVSNLNGNRFSNDIELSLYRAVQEIINNTIKHSKATLLELNLSYQKKCIILKSSDNGIGMDTTDNLNKGLGLSSMKNRIEAIKGTIETISAPNKGTQINIQIPTKNINYD